MAQVEGFIQLTDSVVGFMVELDSADLEPDTEPPPSDAESAPAE